MKFPKPPVQSTCPLRTNFGRMDMESPKPPVPTTRPLRKKIVRMESRPPQGDGHGIPKAPSANNPPAVHKFCAHGRPPFTEGGNGTCPPRTNFVRMERRPPQKNGHEIPKAPKTTHPPAAHKFRAHGIPPTMDMESPKPPAPTTRPLLCAWEAALHRGETLKSKTKIKNYEAGSKTKIKNQDQKLRIFGS